MPRPLHYEEDAEAFPHDNYTAKGFEGIALWVRGWATEPDEDTDWTGQEVRTGKVDVVMVGDDYHHHVDPEDLVPLKRSAFCGGCGQIGCHCDGYEDDEVEARHTANHGRP